MKLNIPYYKQTNINDCGFVASKISNSLIDQYYSIAKNNGAIGGKISGTGGGGFLMLIVPKHKQKTVLKSLNHLNKIDIKFSYNGSKVIFSN